MFHLQENFADASLDAYNLSQGHLAHQVSLEAYELQNEKEVVATLMYILLTIIYNNNSYIHTSQSSIPSSVILNTYYISCDWKCDHI